MICPLVTTTCYIPPDAQGYGGGDKTVYFTCQQEGCQWWLSMTLEDGSKYENCAAVVLAAQKLPLVKR